jgi:hypothetical protein
MEHPTTGEGPEQLAQAIREDLLDEIAELEEYAKLGKAPPHSRGYGIKVNGIRVEIYEPEPTAREILLRAGFTPPENYTLREKVAGHKPRPLALDERVNLRKPGIEKFKALPNDQTEG